MGITGLLPFLKKSSRTANINEFAGESVAIDTYCWLHKGIFSCAEKLSLGEPTDAYIIYCMKFIKMLLKYNIKPILVFDGRHLPAKADTEAKRHEMRERKRRQAAELIRSGQTAEGRNLLKQSIDVTHEIALELIKTCQSLNIDCIVAPYEADAQLAYLNISGIADIVITEDSDLTLFGCKRVFFKMDVNGNGTLVEQDKLHLAMDVKSTDFDMDKFRYMCILSGCDYLPSLRGIGLAKAKKFIQSMNSNSDIYKALTNLGICLNMKSLTVSKEYKDNFMKAFVTFKHQLVFCPLQRKQVRLNSPSADVSEDQLYYAGEEIDPDKALQLAYGNCDPFTFKKLHDFDPDKKQNLNKVNPKMLITITKHISIWSRNYKLKQSPGNMYKKETTNYEHHLSVKEFCTSEKKSANLKKKEYHPDVNIPNYQELNEKDILDTYKSEESIESENAIYLEKENVSDVNEQKSPILTRKTNPFVKEVSSNEISPSLLFKRRSRIKPGRTINFRKTIIDENVITESKFFTNINEDIDKNNAKNNDNDVNFESDELCISHTSKKMKIEVDDRKCDLKYLTELNNLDNTYSINTKQSDQNILVNENKNAIANRNMINEETFTTQDMCSSNHTYESKILFTSTNEVEYINFNANDIMNNYNCNMPQSNSPTSESDYSVSQNSVEDNTNSSFKFSNIKLNPSNDIHSSKTIKKQLTSFQMRTNKKSTIKRDHRSKQLSSEHGQLSLLNMFGFEKKQS
ncbi:exonuclease 1-like isoform X1 [Vespa mandarinia]|uniref:exonuclease 1-like isoform X1 n=2 Tax=Vespa mandarinia TaxID=7446 RepID=UPI00160EC5C3|nr:exonuclease 1-like isoform X1 [Vespa mandarinia]